MRRIAVVHNQDATRGVAEDTFALEYALKTEWAKNASLSTQKTKK